MVKTGHVISGLMCCLLLAGCSVYKSAARTLYGEPSLYPTQKDSIHTQKRDKQWADAAWQDEIGANREAACSVEYERGFKEGFADYLYAGGTGEPPPVPPRRLWNLDYRTPKGHQAVDDWFAGFRRGAAVVRERGYREQVTLHASLLPGGRVHASAAPAERMEEARPLEVLPTPSPAELQPQSRKLVPPDWQLTPASRESPPTTSASARQSGRPRTTSVVRQASRAPLTRESALQSEAPTRQSSRPKTAPTARQASRATPAKGPALQSEETAPQNEEPVSQSGVRKAAYVFRQGASAAATNELARQSETPARQSEEPAAQSEKPARQSEKPAPQSEEPAAQSEEPAAQSEEPALRSDLPRITLNARQASRNTLTKAPVPQSEEPTSRSMPPLSAPLPPISKPVRQTGESGENSAKANREQSSARAESPSAAYQKQRPEPENDPPRSSLRFAGPKGEATSG